MTRTLGIAAAALISALPALAEEPTEHWRCGPYFVTLIPADSYDRSEHSIELDHATYIIRRNGREPEHEFFRARMNEIEKGGCRYHSCPNGARAAWWEGMTQDGKYNSTGELLTIDGVTHYTETIMGGKTGRTLRSEKHLCRQVPAMPAGAAAICKGGIPVCDKPPLQRACQDPESGIEFPKGYQCVGEDKIGWQCQVGAGPGGTGKFYKAKGGGGKRKKDAICE
jgi:hypothetical protein